MWPIGYLRSPYREKFGVPRQPGLVDAAACRLELVPPYDAPESVRGLEEFTHVWVLFSFHLAREAGWKPLVRPPRLGGNRKLGVFASRAPFRPNHIGMSAAALDRVVIEQGRAVIHLSGLDVVDGTPVLDLKPYVPYADCLPDAGGGFASARPPSRFEVRFSEQARRDLARASEDYLELVRQVLSADPRPAYQRDQEDGRVFGVALGDYNLRWRVSAGRVEVLEARRLERD